MPTLSYFYGIEILMRFLDHNAPHIHAKYQGNQITIDIKDGKVKGEISERALRLILEWLEEHREELLACWEKVSNGIDPGKVAPLD